MKKILTEVLTEIFHSGVQEQCAIRVEGEDSFMSVDKFLSLHATDNVDNLFVPVHVGYNDLLARWDIVIKPKE